MVVRSVDMAHPTRGFFGTLPSTPTPSPAALTPASKPSEVMACSATTLELSPIESDPGTTVGGIAGSGALGPSCHFKNNLCLDILNSTVSHQE